MKHKEIHLLIEKKLRAGMSKSQVMEELSIGYSDKNKLAKQIAFTVSPEAKIKYKAYNNVLLSLLILMACIKLFCGILPFRDNFSDYSLITFLEPLLFSIFAIRTFQYDGFNYGFIVIITLATILRSLANVDMYVELFVFDLFVGFAVIVLASFLKTGMLPNVGYFGPRKSADGSVILEE